MSFRLFLVLFFLKVITAQSQCPTAGFTAQDSICLNETFTVSNESLNSSSHEWFFCDTDFSTAPAFSKIVNGYGAVWYSKVFETGGQTYLFFLSQTQNKLVGLRITNLASFAYELHTEIDLSSILANPGGLDLFEENGIWHGIITTVASPFKIFKIQLASDLKSITSSSDLTTIAGVTLNVPFDAKIKLDAGNYFAFVAANSSATATHQIVRYSFGTSLNNTPTASTISLPTGARVASLDFYYNCTWTGFVSSRSGKVFRMDFGTSLASAPVITDLTLSATLNDPAGVALVEDHNEFVLLLQSRNSSTLYAGKISSLTDNTVDVVSLGNFKSTTSDWDVEVFRVNGVYKVLTQNFNSTTGGIYSLTFATACNGSLQYATTEDASISYGTSGSHKVTLKTTSSSGNTDRITKELLVTSSVAPAVSILCSDVYCKGSSMPFELSTTSSLSEHTWDFGDGSGSSSVASPSYSYNTIGSYEVTLNVTSEEGCANTVSKTIKITDSPQASFTVPSGEICTNNTLTFSNTTPDNYEGHLSYQWYVNDEAVSTEKDLLYTFTAAGSGDVKLAASIPGCSSTVVEQVNGISNGPDVQVMVSGQCEGEETRFSSTISGDVESILWDFGNEDTTTDSEPVRYLSKGVHPVRLTVTGTNGCITTKTDSVKIYSHPTVDFTVTGSPAAINSPISFTDGSTADDGIMTSWSWDFGDYTSSSIQNPSHTYANEGNYTVRLTGTDDHGCTGEYAEGVVVLGACPQALFSLPDSVCLNTSIELLNSSVDGSSYEWYFCDTDYDQTPGYSKIVSGYGAVYHSKIIEKDGMLYLLFMSQSQNKLMVLKITDAETMSYSIHAEIDLSGILSSPAGFDVIEENGEWFGLISTITSPYKLMKIGLGSDFESMTGSSDLSALNGLVLNVPFEVKLVKDGSSYYGFVANSSGLTSQQLARLEFGTSLSQIPKVTNIGLPSGSQASGLEFLYSCNLWTGYVSSRNGKLYRVDFSHTLSSAASVSEITADLALNDPTGLAIVEDHEVYELIIQSRNGNVYTGSLSEVRSSSISLIDHGNVKGTSRDWDVEVFRVNGVYKVLTQNFNSTTGGIYALSFPTTCGGNIRYSEDENLHVTYTVNGNHKITLKAIGESARVSRVTKELFVRDAVAPTVSIVAPDIFCSESSLSFNLSSDQPLTKYYWDFGDSVGSSTEPYPQYQYNAEGTYNVRLITENTDECRSFTQKEIRLYNQPVAAFVAPEISVCTNNEVTFLNTTLDEFNGFLSYEWYVNNEMAGTQRDLKYTFKTTSNHEIRLKAIIPGCSSDHIQIIDQIGVGPLVNFTWHGQCENDWVDFTNESEGEITGYLWNFSNLAITDEENPSYQFAYGVQNVSLTASAANGCETTVSKEIFIYAKPNVNFEVANGSVICTEKTIVFKDLTTPGSDTVNLWSWVFGDNSTSNEKNPEHTFATSGSKNISLTVKDVNGCVATSSKTIKVSKTPELSYTHKPLCVGIPVDFEASASEEIKMLTWSIGDKEYFSSDPVHTFRTAGTYSSTLSVTATNGCEALLSSNLFLPDVLKPDFTITNNCLLQSATLRDITSGDDVVDDWLWIIDGDTIGNDVTATHTFTAEGEEDVTLHVTTNAGCNYTKTKTIEITHTPDAEFSMSTPFGAPPLPVQFANTSSGATSYHWSFGDGTSTDEQSPEHIFDSLDVFKITLTVSNSQGCVDSVAKTVTLSEPRPDISIIAITSNDNSDGTVRLTINIENKGNTVLENLPVNVDISGKLSLKEIISAAIMPLSRYNHALSYELSREDLQFVCATAELEGDLDLSSNKFCAEFKNHGLFVLPAYPNPVKDIVHAEWTALSDETITVSLVNGQGTKVSVIQVNSKKGFNTLKIPVRELQKGLYMMLIESKSIKSVQKLLIAK